MGRALSWGGCLPLAQPVSTRALRKVKKFALRQSPRAQTSQRQSPRQLPGFTTPTQTQESTMDASNLTGNHLTDTDLLERLRWRYAVKKFNPARRISPGDWLTLEQALILSPSSYGLQPYHFLVINDPKLRAQLSEASYGQSQVEECSRFVVFAIRKNIDAVQVDRFIARIAEVRNSTVASLSDYRSAIIRDLIDGPRHAWIDHWSARQVYIALGNLLTCATILGIDACPMEGFEPDRYNEILDLPGRGLSAVVACALGYRSEEDKHALDAKVRFASEDLIEHRDDEIES